MKTYLRSRHVRPLRSLNVAASIFVLLFLTSGCSLFGGEAPELPEHNLTTKGLSTATGAAVGAGLGLIVGSESGNAGEGFVIGGLAGAAAGALIGNELENQEELAEIQKEEMVRQDETLGNQRREIDQLRDSASDVPVTNSPSQGGLHDSSSTTNTYRGNPRAKPVTGYSSTASSATGGRSNMGSTTDTKSAHVATPRARYDTAKPSSPSASPSASLAKSTTTASETSSPAALPRAATSDSSLPPAHVSNSEDAEEVPLQNEAEAAGLAGEELVGDDETVAETTIAAVEPGSEDITGEDANCGKAQEEVERAKTSSSQADQLFYLRRALRLCPRNAHYHVQIGKVYASMGREEDAQYEFRQALDLEPGNAQAREALNHIKEGESGPVASRQTTADGDIEF